MYKLCPSEESVVLGGRTLVVNIT